MTTHRSLNKLEFKAHMSIHNKVEVREEETRDANHTRDRFGKKHRLTEADGNARIRPIKKTALCLLVIPLVAAWPAMATPKVNMTVESEPMDELMRDISDRPEERFAFYRDGDSELGLNENGDPNMSMRF